MRFQVKSGATRHAVIIGNWVFKIPYLLSWKMFLQGLLSNMQERQWRGTSLRLCPVRFSVLGGFLNVMPYARPLTDDEWAAMDKSAFDKFRRTTTGYFLPIEYKRDSLGMLVTPSALFEVPVAVDYGS